MSDPIHPSDEQLLELAEGTLGWRARRKVATHVERCAQCAELVAASRAGQQALQSRQTHVAMPDAAAERLHARLADEWQLRQPGRRAAGRLPGWRRQLNVALAVGLVASVVGAVVVATNEADEGTRSLTDPQAQQRFDNAESRPQAPAGQEGAEQPSAAGADLGAAREGGAAADEPAMDAERSTTAGGGSVTVTEAVRPPTCVLEIAGEPLLVEPPATSTPATTTPLGPIGSLSVRCYVTPG